MPVTLEGSCHCKAVNYTVESNTPVPYQLCQCTICRKVGGYMGSVNIMGNTDTLKVTKGEDVIKKYQAIMTFTPSGEPKEKAGSQRSFCSICSTMLWVYDDQWSNWIYPFASSIDTELSAPPGFDSDDKGKEGDGAGLIAIKRDSCPSYVPVPEGAKRYDGYGPGEGIEEWHKKHGLWVE